MAEIKTLGPVGLNPTGEYDGTKTYEKLDVVIYQGSSYVARAESIGQLPTNQQYWQKLVSGGVGVDDIVDNLESTDSDKPLSAKQGNILDIKTEQVKYVFPKSHSHTGDYIIIKAYGKNLLIDCTVSADWQEFKSVIDENNISHFDIFILSHFHDDHVGNFINLVDNGYIDENTTIYFPTYDTTLWSTNSSYPFYLAVMQKVQEAGLSYINPSEGQKIVLNEYCSFTIHNTNDVFAYNNISANYNETSMIVIFKHYDINVLLLGDCGKPAITYYYNQGIFPDLVHVYKMGHHGIDIKSTSIYEIIKNISILNAVQSISVRDLRLGKSAGGGTYSDIVKQTNNIFVSGYNENNIVFISACNQLERISGTNSIGSAKTQDKAVDIYVDSENASETKEDGSEAYPFKDLNQAIGSIDKNNGISYTIHLAAGTYNAEGGLNNNRNILFGITNKITIVGASKDTVTLKRGFNITNCSNVIIQNITIDNEYDERGIRCENSTVMILNVVYTQDSSQTLQNAMTFDNCKAIITDCSIENANTGISEYYSDLTIYNVSFTNNTNACLLPTGGTILHKNITVTDTSNLIANVTTLKGIFINGFEMLDAPFDISTYTDKTATMNQSILKFTKLKIEYKIDNRRLSKIIDLTGDTSFYTVLDMVHVSTKAFLREAVVKFDMKKVTIENCREMQIETSGAGTILNPFAGLTITSIKGY